jgi:hypothetical protein
MIENALKHLYYADHPVEFGWIGESERYYLSTKELFSYARRHPALVEPLKRYKFIGNLETKYHGLSSNVHARSLSDMDGRRRLEDIRLEVHQLEWLGKTMPEISSDISVLLTLLHKDKFASFRSETRSILLSALTPTQRRLVQE